MRIKDVLYYIGTGLAIGFTLIAYANSNFTTKEVTELMKDDLKYIRSRVDDINEKLK